MIIGRYDMKPMYAWILTNATAAGLGSFSCWRGLMEKSASDPESGSCAVPAGFSSSEEASWMSGSAWGVPLQRETG
jgi:hypothetical protein